MINDFETNDKEKDLHSNMVRFIISIYSESQTQNEKFTFQYG